MAAIFPFVPGFVFTVFEPLSLLAGAVAPFISPEWFIAEQTPLSSLEVVGQNARMVACQLGNVYLLLAMVGVGVLYTTTEAKVARNYIIALWLADIGHIAITCCGMEYERLVDIAHWNSMTWGNIAVTVFLFLTRTAYLVGLFGPDRQPRSAVKKIQ